MCGILLPSCVEKKKTLIDEMNESSLDMVLSSIAIDEIIGMSEGRNIVYILDGTCSICIAKYVILCNSLESEVCQYDSLITVVNGWSDMMVANYNLKKSGIKRPEREKVIYDKDCKLSNSLYNISRNNCLMLFENRRLIYMSTIPNMEMQ